MEKMRITENQLNRSLWDIEPIYQKWLQADTDMQPAMPVLLKD